MSAEATVVEKELEVEKKPAEPFLSKRRKNIVTDPLSDDKSYYDPSIGYLLRFGGYREVRAYFGDVNRGSICYRIC
jgi:hypothetical protein